MTAPNHNPQGFQRHVNASWSAAQIQTLADLYRRGEPYSVIGARTGHSRNAAIGKAQRLVEAKLLEPRREGIFKNESTKSQAARQIRAISAAQRRAWAAAKPPNNHDDTPRPPKVKADLTGGEAPPTARPWLTRRKSECRWPIGEPGYDMLMCCARAGHGPDGEYCATHHARGWKAA